MLYLLQLAINKIYYFVFFMFEIEKLIIAEVLDASTFKFLLSITMISIPRGKKIIKNHVTMQNVVEHSQSNWSVWLSAVQHLLWRGCT